MGGKLLVFMPGADTSVYPHFLEVAAYHAVVVSYFRGTSPASRQVCKTLFASHGLKTPNPFL